MPDIPELPHGFRYVVKEDTAKDLRSFVPEMDKYTLADYYQWSLDENSLVIIREIEENIAAIALVTIQDDHLMLELLVRNKLYPYQGSAGDLVIVMEKLIAPHFGKKELRLEAMEHVVKYYTGRGYETNGKPYHDEVWGDLTPMVKRLSS